MIASAALAVLLTALTPTQAPPLPLAVFQNDPPQGVMAEAYVLIDLDAGLVLAAREADQPRALASVTKLMTALVVVDNAELGDIVTISQGAADTGEAEIGLVAGETWTVWELLNAILVRSGNDAATALAEHVGGSVAGFAEMMNAKALELGMAGSSFVNPHGLDADGHFSTANDLTLLGRAAFEDPVISQLARTRVVKFRPAPDGSLRRATNTNELLGAFEGVVGLKTGYTSDAGRVLVSAATRHGRTLLAVVMGTEDHFADTRELLDYGFDMYGLADRVVAPLGGEQGDGTPSALSEAESARLLLMPDLPAFDTTGPRSLTPLEERLAALLRTLIPPLVASP